MNRSLSLVSYLVREYDEAIRFFVDQLGFVVVEDTQMTETKRWVRVAPNRDSSFALLLARAANDEQISHIGNQSGGRVFLFLQTDDLDRDYRDMSDRGIRFLESPRQESYGFVAVFADLYGNTWDLIEPVKIQFS